MNTDMIHTDHEQAISRGLKVLQSGGIIAFPTDTVYGIGSLAFHQEGIKKLYQVKDRDRKKAIPILIGEIHDLARITVSVSPIAISLMERYWPGPLTVILKKHERVPDEISPTDTVGVRIPDHVFMQRFLTASGPLAATSANLSGKASAHTAAAVREQLMGRIELILDGGETRGEQASTVVDCTTHPPRILRTGPISDQDIHDLLQNGSQAASGWVS